MINLPHGEHWQKSDTTDAKIIALSEKLTELGYENVIVGKHSFNVAIALPCGLPLYINFSSAYADRAKGFLHFSTFTTVRSKKVSEIKERFEKPAPNRFTVATMTAKKLDAVIAYWDEISALALAAEKDADNLLGDWRERLAASPYEFHPYSHKENSTRAINGYMRSSNFEFKFSISQDYPYASEPVEYSGANGFNKFLALSDDTSDEKQWFNVDFTGGLPDCVALHLCYGTQHAVTLWAKKNESIYGGIGHIVTALPCFPRSTVRVVHVVRLGELLS